MKAKQVLILLLILALTLAGLLCLNKAVRALELAVFPQKYSAAVEQYAAAYQVEPALVYAIIRTESGFDPKADSNVGARGLMQITEETFLWIKSKIAPQEALTFEDLYTPEVNIRFGTYLLSVCMQRYGGDIPTASAAYHSGIGKVDELLKNKAYSTDGVILHTFPYQQMNNYVRKVQNNYEKYLTLYA